MNIHTPPDKADFDAASEFDCEALQAVFDEIEYADKKHGDDKHTTMEWIGIIEGMVNRAKNNFSAGGPECEALMLANVRKITATGLMCLYQRGYVPRVEPVRVESVPLKQNAAINDYFDLRKAIEININLYSAENGSNTPDFILAQYLIDCLAAYDKAVTAREKWYGREPKPVPPDQAPPSPVGREFFKSI